MSRCVGDGTRAVPLTNLGWRLWLADRDPAELTVFQKMEFNAISRVGFIFQMYHTRTWWYEILDLGRKLMLTGLIAFIENGSATQVSEPARLGT